MKRGISLLLTLVMVIGIFANIPITVNAATSGKCGDNLTWILDDEGTLTITGTGDMYNYTVDNSIQGRYPTHPWGAGVKKVYINEGVTSQY